MQKLIRVGAVVVLTSLVAVAGCKKKDKKKQPDTTGQTGKPDNTPPPTPSKTLKGVDMDNKVVRIGALNDESGPAAAIGKPFAVGKRVLVKQVNAGNSGLLPEGWKLELVERDHGYNPQQSVQQYNAIKDDVLYIATSFGTPTTLPLRDMLKRDKLIAFPASLSSEMAAHENTPPLGASYHVEAMRALDWAVTDAGGADKVSAGIVYQKDDAGQDCLNGWKHEAAAQGVKIVAEQTVAPGQKDVTAVVTALKEAGANYVMLGTIPSATGPILGTAAQLEYAPQWFGFTASWVDQFFEGAIPAPVFANFHLATSMPYWNEDVPGMETFMNNYRTYGANMHPPNSYILLSYVQGLIQLEALNKAIEAGDVSREGYAKALRTIKDWNAGGMMPPVDLTQFPYVTGTSTRILKPIMDKKSWEVVAPFAPPESMSSTGGGDHAGHDMDMDMDMGKDKGGMNRVGKAHGSGTGGGKGGGEGKGEGDKTGPKTE